MLARHVKEVFDKLPWLDAHFGSEKDVFLDAFISPMSSAQLSVYDGSPGEGRAYSHSSRVSILLFDEKGGLIYSRNWFARTFLSKSVREMFIDLEKDQVFCKYVVMTVGRRTLQVYVVPDTPLALCNEEKRKWDYDQGKGKPVEKRVGA